MLLSKLDKNIVKTTWRYLSTHVNTKSVHLLCSHNFSQQTNLKFLRAILSPSLHRKTYSTSSDPQNTVLLPPLTDNQLLTWPNFFKSCGNFVRCNFVIKPYMDSDFNIPDFIEGSKQALSVVSSALANEDFESIKELVTDDAIQIVKNKVSTLSPEQKQLLAINKDDIYVTFPYEIGIMFDKENAEQRFVEITVVYHSLRGLSKMREQKDHPVNNPGINIGFSPEYQKLLFVCNYRFIRELTKGVESSWTINMINHFSLAHIQD